MLDLYEPLPTDGVWCGEVNCKSCQGCVSLVVPDSEAECNSCRRCKLCDFCGQIRESTRYSFDNMRICKECLKMFDSFGVVQNEK